MRSIRTCRAHGSAHADPRPPADASQSNSPFASPNAIDLPALHLFHHFKDLLGGLMVMPASVLIASDRGSAISEPMRCVAVDDDAIGA